MFFRRATQDDTSSDDLHLIVGLGNPGSRYEDTRHNAGFMVVDRLAGRGGLQFKGSKHRADTAKGTIEGLPILLAKPVTFMNESGNAVSRLIAYYRIPLNRLLVVYDEIDLPFGTLRLRPSGSAAGNRGLDSIIKALGTDQFARLRFGVGRPPGDAIPHVLGRFSAEEEPVLPGLLDAASDAVISACARGVEATMNEYNKNWLAG